jgi:alkaline phosphatase
MMNRAILRGILALSIILNANYCLQAQSNPEVKNVILLIGDGMGLSQITYAMQSGVDRMNFERFQSIGLLKTSSSSHKITDSGAGATAYSTGQKTYNGAIGVDSLKRSLPTILELAEKKGLSTGLVATCAITHATPASFIAHQASRDSYDAIAADFLKTDVDVFIGGGLDNFNKRSDKLDLITALNDRNYEVITDLSKLYTYAGDKKIAALVAPKHLAKMQDGRANYLPTVTELSLNKLAKNPNGFFIMIEGSQIDWGGHANDAEYIRQEVIDFDKAIGIALDFASKNKNTLVIVTADHETGGFALSGNEDDKNNKNLAPSFNTKNHTAVMVPVFAFGPGAESLQGIHENTYVFEVMKKAMGL